MFAISRHFNITSVLQLVFALSAGALLASLTNVFVKFNDNTRSVTITLFRGLAGLALPRLIVKTRAASQPQWTAFRPLPGPEWIRLCKFDFHPNGKVLSLSLHYFKLEDAPPYDALSYTWGPSHGGIVTGDGTYLDMFDGFVNRSVPMNLVRAVENIPEILSVKHYWIDSICIDQLNHTERSEQVGLMGQIYQRASMVQVWLGTSFNDTLRINEMLHEILRKQNVLKSLSEPAPCLFGYDPIDPTDYETLVQILSRRWFHRLWTWQEFALAKNLRMWCGDVLIDVDLLTEAAIVLGHTNRLMDLSYGNDRLSNVPSIVHLSLLRDAVRNPKSMNADFMRCFRHSSTPPPLDYESILAWVYWRSISTMATDKRDYVFGILGVANAIASALDLEFEPFEPDYSLSVAEAYQKFIERLMRGSFGLRSILLVRKQLDYVLQHPSDTPTQNLPSWVPDLANRNYFSLSMNGGGVTFRRNDSCFSIIDTLRYPKRTTFTVHNDKLFVRGQAIGVINAWSPAFPINISRSKGITPVSEAFTFFVNLILHLTPLPDSYPFTGQSPIEALLCTLYRGDSSGENMNMSRLSSDMEARLVDAIMVMAMAKVNENNASCAKVFQDIVKPDHRHNPWKIPALESFPTAEELEEYCEQLRDDWMTGAGSRDLGDRISAMMHQTESMTRMYGTAVSNTKIFVVDIAPEFSSSAPGELALIGIGPDMLYGDCLLFAIDGIEWPVILRRADQLGEFELVGEGYVHGIMHGELFRNPGRDSEWENIVLI